MNDVKAESTDMPDGKIPTNEQTAKHYLYHLYSPARGGLPIYCDKNIEWLTKLLNEAEERGRRGRDANIGSLVEATDQLIAETDVECDCVEAWASDVEPHMCAKHAAIEALRPFKKEGK